MTKSNIKTKKEKQLTKYHLNLYNKEGKVIETFTLTSTGEILPGIWYNRKLGLHPQIKKATNYPSSNKAPKGEAYSAEKVAQHIWSAYIRGMNNPLTKYDDIYSYIKAITGVDLERIHIDKSLSSIK